jgi:ketosteroid isomerase-like protein
MSHENVEAFLEVNEAMRRGDVEAVLRHVDEEGVLLAARSAVEGAYRGHNGVRRFMADNSENFEKFEPDFTDVRDLGDRVLGLGTIRVRGRGSGVETDIPAAGVATFNEKGKMVRWEDFRERHLALEAVGLRE